MKAKKILMKIILVICILFAITLATNNSYALIAEIAAGGTMVGIFISIAQVACVALGLVGQTIITSITAALGGAHSSVWSVKDVIFNRSTATTASYFVDFNNENGFKMGLPYASTDGLLSFDGPIVAVFKNVTNFYYIIRNLSIAALLFILLYIGIRMAISTVASEEAKYKKMLGHWVVSMASIFVLHYIMIFTLYCNNILVSILYQFVDDINLGYYAALATEGLVPILGIGEAIVFLMLIGVELTFLFMYIKRVITLGFLIVIAPLITVTYSIDKLGDGKSQALNTWLKEFVFTVLIQPFHCIIYIVLVQTVLESMAGVESIGSCVIYILMLKFMKDAEGIVKKIFGIQSDGMPGHSAMGALALGIMSQFGSKKGGKKNKGGMKDDRKMPNMKKEQGASNTTEQSGVNTDGQNNRNNNEQNGESTNETGESNASEPTSASEGNNAEEVSNESTEDTEDTQEQVNGSDGENAGNNSKGKPKFKDQYKKAFEGTVKRLGGKKGIIKKGITYGAGAAALGVGLGMADEKAAIGAALMAQAGAESIEDALEDHQNQILLESNEDAFKEKYNNYIEQYQRTHEGVTTAQIHDDISNLFKDYDEGTKTRNDFENDPDFQDLLDAREDMIDSYDIAGAGDANGMVKRLCKQAVKEKILAERRLHGNGE